MSLTDWLFTNQAYNSHIFIPLSHLHLISFLKTSSKSVSLAGGQYSSGGQTLIDNGVVISLNKLNLISDIDLIKQEYTVEAGASWHHVIDALSKVGLTPLEMQSYKSFTIGGSISVEAHGRLSGRISDSIVWLDVITVDGNILRCSKKENPELYYAVVGGYGLIGIIWRARLKAQPNKMLICQVYSAGNDLAKDIEYFASLSSSERVLYNCEISNIGQSHHILWSETDENYNPPVGSSENVFDRLFTRFGENIMALISPVHDWYQTYRPYHINTTKRWLSDEMGYNATDLVPLTPFRLFQSLLQEYFLPLNYINDFLSNLKILINKYQVNVLNQSIRLVASDGSPFYLDWAPEDRVAVVLYINVFNFSQSESIYREFTRKVIDLVLQLDGTWYLPYYTAFTKDQLLKGYPRINEFIKIKKKYDPENRLSSKFWNYIQNLLND